MMNESISETGEMTLPDAPPPPPTEPGIQSLGNEMARWQKIPCFGCGKTGEGGSCARCRVKDQHREAARQHIERMSATWRTIPRAYQGLRLDAADLALRVQDGRAIARAKDLLDCRWLLIRGPSGVGKTSLASAMLRAWAEGATTGDGVFSSCVKLGEIRALTRLGERATVLDNAFLSQLVLLDDLGAEADSKINATPDVVHERHAEDRATWITTGLTDAQIQARYGDRIARRLLERATQLDLT